MISAYICISVSTWMAFKISEKDCEAYEMVATVIFWPLVLPAFVIVKLIED